MFISIQTDLCEYTGSSLKHNAYYGLNNRRILLMKDKLLSLLTRRYHEKSSNEYKK